MNFGKHPDIPDVPDSEKGFFPMKKFIVPSDKDGKKVVRVALSQFPELPSAEMQRALKKKDVRVNGKRIARDLPVFAGDEVELWLPDASFAGDSGKRKENAADPDYKIVFESDDLLLVNKRQGLTVHPGKGTRGETLIDIVRREQNNPKIDLCHRIDRNTGGLLLLAKNKNALEDAAFLFREKLVVKRYRCLVKGIPTCGENCVCDDETIMKEVSAYIEKTGSGSVFIHDLPEPGDLPITSRYRIIREFRKIGPQNESVSELEVELETGRTHQIRAQFSHLGHPILGDGYYGRNQFNRFFLTNSDAFLRYQQLFASSLLFGKIPKGNRHFSLSGRTFSIVPRYDLPFCSQ